MATSADVLKAVNELKTKVDGIKTKTYLAQPSLQNIGQGFSPLNWIHISYVNDPSPDNFSIPEANFKKLAELLTTGGLLNNNWQHNVPIIAGCPVCLDFEDLWASLTSAKMPRTLLPRPKTTKARVLPLKNTVSIIANYVKYFKKYYKLPVSVTNMHALLLVNDLKNQEAIKQSYDSMLPITEQLEYITAGAYGYKSLENDIPVYRAYLKTLKTLYRQPIYVFLSPVWHYTVVPFTVDEAKAFLDLAREFDAAVIWGEWNYTKNNYGKLL